MYVRDCLLYPQNFVQICQNMTLIAFFLINKTKFQLYFSSSIQMNRKACLYRFSWQIVQSFFVSQRTDGLLTENLFLEAGKENLWGKSMRRNCMWLHERTTVWKSIMSHFFFLQALSSHIIVFLLFPKAAEKHGNTVIADATLLFRKFSV